MVGPKLLNPTERSSRRVRGFPTRWRLATEYLFLRWFAPRSRALNAFYAAGFDHRSVRDAEFLVGAVLSSGGTSFTRSAVFDTSFFMFNEEVDFCYRVREAELARCLLPRRRVRPRRAAPRRASTGHGCIASSFVRIFGSWPSTAASVRANRHDAFSSSQWSCDPWSSAATAGAFPGRLRGGLLRPMLRRSSTPLMAERHVALPVFSSAPARANGTQRDVRRPQLKPRRGGHSSRELRVRYELAASALGIGVSDLERESKTSNRCP